MVRLLGTAAAVATVATGFLGLIASPAAAQSGGLFDRPASVTYGPYVRLELGAARVSPQDGHWRNGPGDPRVDFDLDGEWSGLGGFAVGYDWMNGFRGEVALLATGRSDISGPCRRASDGSSCATHADITGAPVRTTALMANLYYSPLEQRGSNSVFQPFVVAGLGVAQNDVSDWTRFNPGSGRETRTFEGDTNTDVAWSAGVGAALQVSSPGEWPILIEGSWRYYNFGTARGSSTPLPGEGSGRPEVPLTFENRSQIVSVGVRIPLQKY